MFLSLGSRARAGFCVAAFSLAVLIGSNVSLASPLAVGAVEQVDLKTSAVVVLGQHYHITAGTLLTSQRSHTSSLSLTDVSPDSLVLVDGEQSPSGATRVDAIVLLTGANVPGASQLLLTGVVGAVGTDGWVRIGQLKVDVTATLSSTGSALAAGDFVKVLGIQPTAQGVFLAQSITRANGVRGTGGFSAAGVGGTGALADGVGGTGGFSAAGVGGTGALADGVGGTGGFSAAGVGGTGALADGVGGAGRLSVAGVRGTGQ